MCQSGPRSPGKALIGRLVEIVSECSAIDVRALGCHRGDFHLRHELTATACQWSQFGNGFSVTRDHEARAGLDSVQDLRIPIAQLTLSDGPTHLVSVANIATDGYTRLVREYSASERSSGLFWGQPILVS